jgi:hypothetical protein
MQPNTSDPSHVARWSFNVSNATHHALERSNTMRTLETTTTICSMDLVRGADTVNHNTPTHNRQMSRNTYRQFVGMWVQEDIECEVTVWDETNNGRSRRLYSVTILPNPNQLEYLNFLNRN